MEDTKSQNDTQSISKKSKETNNINDSQENPIKDTNPLNITDDSLPIVRLILFITSKLTLFIKLILQLQYSNKRKTKQKHSSNRILTTNDSTLSKFNEIQLMKKINKEFDEKCIKIRNRIQRLKKEEEECLKQRINFKKKEKHDKLIREDKQKFKKEVKKLREERDKELIYKKTLIQNKRIRENKYRETKKNENLSQKKLNYQSSLNEKYLMKIIREQLNTLQLNKNTYSHAKIKQELNEYETNRMKRNLEKENMNKKLHEHNIKQLKLLEEEMKNTCDQLEELEKQAFDKLKRTKYMNLRLFSAEKTRSNFPKQKRFKINHNKNMNRTMENIKLNEINSNKTIEIEEKNVNKSMLINKNGFMSPHYIKKDIKLNKINKIKKGFSACAFPKSNKERNRQQLNIKLKNPSYDKKSTKENNHKKNINYNVNKVKSNKSITKK